MPRDTVDRAIKKAAGAAQGDDYAEVRYEGYGPAGVAVIVEALTDNRNRTASRHALRLLQARRRAGGDELGQLHVQPAGRDPLSRPRSPSEDAMLEAAIEAGAENVESDGGGARDHLRGRAISSPCATRWRRGSARPRQARLDWRPATTVTLDEERAAAVLKLLDVLEDSDDVQNVYANFDIPDAVMQKLSA